MKDFFSYIFLIVLICSGIALPFVIVDTFERNGGMNYDKITELEYAGFTFSVLMDEEDKTIILKKQRNFRKDPIVLIILYTDFEEMGAIDGQEMNYVKYKLRQRYLHVDNLIKSENE